MAAESASTTARRPVPGHEIEVQTVVESVGLPDAARIRLWVYAALQGQEHPVEVVVRIVDDAEIQGLNKLFRHRDKPTNVLSFPSSPVGNPPLDSSRGGAEPTLLGDLVICAPVVRREAGEQGKMLDAHFAHMVVHGVLHLLGYDHLDDNEAAQMEAAECRVLQGLGYDDPYRDHTGVHGSDGRASDR